MARRGTLRSGQETERAVDERSPLLSRARRESSSSGESSLTSSSSSGDSDGQFLPWHLTPSTEVDETSIDVERTAPIRNDDTKTQVERTPTSAVIKIVLILLVGTFTANADGSLVMATHPTIASEFDDLENSSWLFVSFALAGAATQTLYGKLSDIYGRRALLMVAYTLFAIGCALVGVGRAMWQVVVGRVISGSGGSALNVLGLLLITDLVPLREVAAWQAGINLAATVGRSLGGPVGGWLADTIGWRWSFLGQAPIFLVAVILCWLFLPKSKGTSKVEADESSKPGDPEKSPLGRIDFLGAALLALFILTFLTPIEIGGTKIPWTHPLIFVLFGVAVVFGGLFAATEEWWAKEPIFPLELLKHRDIVLTYVITGGQVAAQLGLMFSVPLYFQVTQRVSNTVAGVHLFPAVAGNAIGSVFAGYLIKKTGRYKSLLVVATLASSFSYVLLLLRWHGDTNAWESLYILPGGLGAGLVQSAGFISVQAAVNPKHKAAATSGIFLTFQIGMILGLSCVSAVMMETMRWRLGALLQEMGLDAIARKVIIEKATSSVDFIDRVDSNISKAVVQAYVEGLGFSHGFSLISSALAFTIDTQTIPFDELIDPSTTPSKMSIPVFDETLQSWVNISITCLEAIFEEMLSHPGMMEEMGREAYFQEAIRIAADRYRTPPAPPSPPAPEPLIYGLPCSNCLTPYHRLGRCEHPCGHCGERWHRSDACTLDARNICKCRSFPQKHSAKRCTILCGPECPKTAEVPPGDDFHRAAVLCKARCCLCGLFGHAGRDCHLKMCRCGEQHLAIEHPPGERQCVVEGCPRYFCTKHEQPATDKILARAAYMSEGLR